MTLSELAWFLTGAGVVLAVTAPVVGILCGRMARLSNALAVLAWANENLSADNEALRRRLTKEGS